MKGTLGIAAALLGAAVALTSSGALAARGSIAPTFRITSSLDGKKVLPIRSRWLAYPKVAPAKVAEVDFLIDGKVRCVEHDAPYNYGSDDLHGHLGWLVTSWLAPGNHRFTVRAVLTDGRKASEAFTARVVPSPNPPVSIAGAWKRTVTDAEVAKVDPSSVGTLPTGEWRLVFDRVGVWDLAKGSGVVEHATFHRDTIRIDAAVWMILFVNGHGSLSRYGAHDIGPGWREDGPPGSYHWSVSGDQLTLTAIRETTGRDLARRAVWEGTWTRVR